MVNAQTQITVQLQIRIVVLQKLVCALQAISLPHLTKLDASQVSINRLSI